ncbi:unnamed protein product [Cylindrotheca closterium]|uniref:Uncharacterized protein n=1 Tax=Cylindrotheca closterium TaxID=2856 RepID=A0AAD2CUD7_9STRA|nr:unnamed protein product [Cylindrotheca closterium]
MDGDNNAESLRTPLLGDAQENNDEEAVVVDETADQEQPEAEDDDSETDTVPTRNSEASSLWSRILHTNVLPDANLFLEGDYLPDASYPLKLIKFIGLTVGMIALIHTFVRTNSHFSSDRDRKLQLWQIAVFEGNYIISDSIIFFMVGRLWKQRGVDHLAWILVVLLCNSYFECQHFFSWLRHSATLYEMHCIWPWQLWAFAGTLIPLIGGVVWLHVQKAWKDGIFGIKILEMSLIAFFYLGPTITSPYFHFHHWFAGWILGMHCNFDVWWSRAAMAWCWGMYINGIAVYGRDPILTCEYAYFVSTDNRCPFVDQETAASAFDYSSSLFFGSFNDVLLNKMDPPADWRNCSAHGYHP